MAKSEEGARREALARKCAEAAFPCDCEPDGYGHQMLCSAVGRSSCLEAILSYAEHIKRVKSERKPKFRVGQVVWTIWGFGVRIKKVRPPSMYLGKPAQYYVVEGLADYEKPLVEESSMRKLTKREAGRGSMTATTRLRLSS